MDFSQESYRERLRTFSATKWFGKPTNLSPLNVALYGWHCIKENTLACQCCNAIVYTSIDSRLGSEMRLKATDMILEKVRNGHKANCMWAGSPSPQSFAEIPSKTQQIAAEVSSRIASLKKISASRSIALSPRINDRIISSNVIHYRNDKQLSKEIIIAATGWRPVSPCPPLRPSPRKYGIKRDDQATEEASASFPQRSDKNLSKPQQRVIILECIGCMQRIRVMLQERHELPPPQQQHRHHDPSDKEDSSAEAPDGAIILCSSVERKRRRRDTVAGAEASSLATRLTTTIATKRRRINGATTTPHKLDGSSISSNKHAAFQDRNIDKLFDPLKFHRAYCPFMRAEKKKKKNNARKGGTAITEERAVATVEHSKEQQQEEDAQKKNNDAKIKDNQRHDQDGVYQGWEKCLVSYLECFGEEEVEEEGKRREES